MRTSTLLLCNFSFINNILFSSPLYLHLSPAPLSFFLSLSLPLPSLSFSLSLPLPSLSLHALAKSPRQTGVCAHPPQNASQQECSRCVCFCVFASLCFSSSYCLSF